MQLLNYSTINQDATNIYGREMDVVYLDFPSLVGKKGESKINEPECTLINFMQHGQKISLKTFLSLIESETADFVKDIFDKKPRGTISVKNTEETLLKINEIMIKFLKLEWYMPWAEKQSASKTDGKYLNAETFLQKFNEMSPGERNLFFITIFLATLATHNSKYTNILLLIDEPELHLHHNMAKNFIETVEDVFKDIPIWVASHSIHMLTRYKFEEITYLENGVIERGTNNLRKKIYDAVMGVQENSKELLLDIESWEYLE